MSKMFTALGDRLLGLFLHEVKSGACCLEFGKECAPGRRFNCFCHCV